MTHAHPMPTALCNPHASNTLPGQMLPLCKLGANRNTPSGCSECPVPGPGLGFIESVTPPFQNRSYEISLETKDLGKTQAWELHGLLYAPVMPSSGGLNHEC